MKPCKHFVLISLLLPAMVMADNFSKVFTGYANSSPIKLQLTGVNSKITGSYEYSKRFNDSLFSNPSYIQGTEVNGVVQLSSFNPAISKFSFSGNLTKTSSNGLVTYELTGQWKDPAKSIDDSVTLQEQNFGSDFDHPLVGQFETAENTNHFYSTQLGYPQFTGSNLTIAEQAINQSIQQSVQNQVAEFVTQVTKFNALGSSDKITVNSNQFSLNTAVVQPGPKVLSLVFSGSSMYAGSAHPTPSMQCLNFDLATGNQISLASLFKDDADYLTVLSNIVRPQLIQKLNPDKKNPDPDSDFDIQLINQGTAAVSKNYAVWSIHQDNLMITFPTYQIAPYFKGPQTVLIPLGQLASIAKPGGLLDQLLAG